MRAVNINTTEGKLLVSIPTYFKELTLGQLIELKNEQLSNVEVIAVLSNIPLSTLYLARDITAFDIFTNSINSLAQEILNVYDATALPKEITFRYLDGKAARKTVKVINNLSIEPVGAFLNCRNIIAEEINVAIATYGEENWKEMFKPSLESALTILSQYFYCRVTGQVYNEYKVEEFQNDVKYLYAYEALPIARAFFFELSTLKNNEEKLLAANHSQEQTAAGIKNFERFGAINTIDALANGDILRWNEVKALPYQEVFVKLLKNKTEFEFNESLQKIREAKRLSEMKDKR